MPYASIRTQRPERRRGKQTNTLEETESFASFVLKCIFFFKLEAVEASMSNYVLYLALTMSRTPNIHGKLNAEA